MRPAVNMRHLEAHAIQLKGELPPADLDLDLRDDVIRAEEPLHYELEIEKLDDAILIQGRLRLSLRCECVRCLKRFDRALELAPWTRHVPLEGEEKAVVVNDSVDLTPYLREDILLEFPQHPLCDVNCGGLPKSVGGKANRPSGAGPSQPKATAWAELDKLKFNC
jgi:uncharacterized metal-binding protein YceD (DUF177 family)